MYTLYKLTMVTETYLSDWHHTHFSVLKAFVTFGFFFKQNDRHFIGKQHFCPMILYSRLHAVIYHEKVKACSIIRHYIDNVL